MSTAIAADTARVSYAVSDLKIANAASVLRIVVSDQFARSRAAQKCPLTWMRNRAQHELS
jgi:hypothetical protein